MDILPVSVYEYLVLFGLCLISFLIGWFSRRRKSQSISSLHMDNDPQAKEIDLDSTTKAPVRAVLTRRRGGEAISPDVLTTPEQSNGAATAHATTEEPQTVPEEKDDLKQINGIGPTIEKKLNSLGVYSFLQISMFTRRDIEKVARHLETYPKKIEKEKWIQQARKLSKSPKKG